MALADRFTVPPVWDGLAAVVIGSGHSFTAAQARAIAIARNRPGSKYRVIAVNDAIFPAWYADWLHAGDTKWWNWHIQHVHTFQGIKTTLAEDIPRRWVSGYLKNTGREGFDPDPSCCKTGASSVYQAMHIAIHTGVSRIILVGVDQHGDHYFGKHPDGIRTDYAGQMLPNYPTLIPALEECGVIVENATPGSALDTFPRIEFEKALR